jgi:transcriptional regulator with XRE-family HTH domain
VGAQLKLIRTRKGLTQEEVGRRLTPYLGAPWHRQQVSAAENGQRAFQVIDLMAMAAVFDVPVTDILHPLLRDPVTFPTGLRWTPREPGHMELSWETLSAVEHLMRDARSSLTAGLSWLRDKANEQRSVPLPDDPVFPDTDGM